MRTLVRIRCAALILLMVCSAGCLSLDNTFFRDPGSTGQPVVVETTSRSLANAELAFAHAVALEERENPTCVDYFYQATTLAWADARHRVDNRGIPSGRSAELYNSALSKLISAGQQFKRLDPRRGLEIQTSSGRIMVPTSYHGFPWQPSDFRRLIPEVEYEAKGLEHIYRWCGHGVATVVTGSRRPNQLFLRDEPTFAATVVLRPESSAANPEECGPFILDLFDPLRCSSTVIGNQRIVLKRDITAPIAFRQNDSDDNFIQNFLQPGLTTSSSGLFMIEPYQPGKIPLVFVHGLLSDPNTWADLANEIRSYPQLLERYQIWGFEYATGEPFLTSAAKMRQQLQEIQVHLDPTCSDPALSNMLLVGHSMGGLVTKLLITHSGNELWNSVSCVPLDQIVTTESLRSRLAKAFYFTPLPSISRVIFIGTPHKGSPWAKRCVGRLGSCLVNEPPLQKERHRLLVLDNPDVFSKEFERRIPTSIDLLESTSPLLLAIDQLPVDRRVKMHSIVGYGYPMLCAGDSDSVVPTSSARKPGVVSEKMIHAKHVKLHKTEQGVQELLNILREHRPADQPRRRKLFFSPSQEFTGLP